MTDNVDVCVICLGEADNKSTSDRCDHIFCFSCIQEWCKVKTTCPLCRQQFSLIIHDKRDIRAYSITFAGIEEAASKIDISQLNVEINGHVTFLCGMMTNAEGIRTHYHQFLDRMRAFINYVKDMIVAQPIDVNGPFRFVQYASDVIHKIEERVSNLNTLISSFQHYMSAFGEASRIVADFTYNLNNSSNMAYDPLRTPLNRGDILVDIERVVSIINDSRQFFVEFANNAEISLSSEIIHYEILQSGIERIEDTFVELKCVHTKL